MMKPELCRPVVASLMTPSNETLKTRTQSGNREASRHYNDLLIGNVSDCGCLDPWHSLQYSLISQIYYTRFFSSRSPSAEVDSVVLTTCQRVVNPLKGRVVNWLHFAIQV